MKSGGGNTSPKQDEEVCIPSRGNDAEAGNVDASSSRLVAASTTNRACNNNQNDEQDNGTLCDVHDSVDSFSANSSSVFHEAINDEEATSAQECSSIAVQEQAPSEEVTIEREENVAEIERFPNIYGQENYQIEVGTAGLSSLTSFSPDTSSPDDPPEEAPNPLDEGDAEDVEGAPENSNTASATSNARATNPDTNNENTNYSSNHHLPRAIPVPEPLTLTAGNANFYLPGNSSIVSASEVVQAQPLENWNHNNGINNEEGYVRGKKRCIGTAQCAVGLILLMILVVAGVVVGVTQSKKEVVNTNANVNGNGNGDSSLDVTVGSNSSNNSSSDALPIYPPFSDNLHFLTQQALRVPSSPQAQANAWMMEDPQRDQYDEEKALQRFALATLFFSTSGNDWERNDQWLDYDIDECQWYNQATVPDTIDDDSRYFPCNEDLHIVELNLSENGLAGFLPVEIFFFPSLSSLDLSYNALSGTAPTMFAGARYLQRLVLSSNRLTGQFTAELGFVASQLKTLHNDGNLFTGALPGLLRLLPNLEYLNITENQYTGTIPSSLSQLSNTLISMEVAYNYITGVLPTQFGLLSRMEVLNIAPNEDLLGTIPTELSTLVNLTALYIEGTTITGSIPQSFCDLEGSGQLQIQADCNGQLQCCL